MSFSALPQIEGLSFNLSSNNPFRNRATSPGHTSPLDAPPRPVSRNPFLDASPTTNEIPRMSPTSSTLTGNAADLFDNLTISDKPKPTRNGMRPPPPRPTAEKPPRPENVPPRSSQKHRPSRSQEEALRIRRAAPGGSSKPRPAKPEELDIFADPEPKKAGERRVRRNSDSSLMERGTKVLDAEEEKKRQDRRRRERRAREGEKDGKGKKPDRKLDIIDQLDATSIYGTGLFHHDGPFDACNPHRNRQGSRRAPMQAFPKDSLNNVLGGGGPLNKRPDHALFMGNNEVEAFKDYSTGGAGGTAPYESYANGRRPTPKRSESAVLSSTQKIDEVHGDESLGLGTSTFLEGAPASRTAIQRREIESSLPEAGGLQRKKSLAQKIRGISTSRREFIPNGRVTSPEGVYSPGSPDVVTPGGTISKPNERNPFFNEFDPTANKKVDSITIVEPENRPGATKAPTSPRRGMGDILERRVTSDSVPEEPKQNMGFLSRVKSLKGGPRKPRG